MNRHECKAIEIDANAEMRREQERIDSLQAWRCRARRKAQREIRRLRRVSTKACLDYWGLSGDRGST